MASSPQDRPPIPVVLVGITRHTALSTSSIVVGTPYHAVAALDLTESPPAYHFSSQNLGVVLHTLYPRPRAVITGTGVSEEVMAAVGEAWKEYSEGVLEKEGLKGEWVALSEWYADENKPPPPGLDKELIRRLDEAFK
ncbi:hypothetical protein LTR36_007081 [Oleoguttula mirabilis]|uniref:Tautomerase cis-CaaD-like domain-containing protein n=1 Tax=Oleoguttula mirabilis TaxID=1507867 RepID=A0AAV9JAA0_9PEZI|nr:hypothetical protein LTR36_007081 [Oleoguttula mirabilis]